MDLNGSGNPEPTFAILFGIFLSLHLGLNLVTPWNIVSYIMIVIFYAEVTGQMILYRKALQRAKKKEELKQ